MIERTLFTPDHESFRDSFRRFMEKEIAPFHADWEEQGYVAREVWNKAGEPIDKANNIYSFADPGRPIQAFDALRDKGAQAAAIATLAWQGSTAATAITAATFTVWLCATISSAARLPLIFTLPSNNPAYPVSDVP